MSRLVDEVEGLSWAAEWLECLGTREVETQSGDRSRWVRLCRRGFIIPQRYYRATRKWAQ